MEKIREPKPPKGLVRWIYRLPLLFYRAGLNAWMGDRFIHLVHIGRVSGLRRETVIEVVEHDRELDIYYLACGWGSGSDWYRNILKTPDVEATVGKRKFHGRAESMQADFASALFCRYGQLHPQTLQTLARIMGYRIEATDSDYRALGHAIPVIAIQVKEELMQDDLLPRGSL